MIRSTLLNALRNPTLDLFRPALEFLRDRATPELAPGRYEIEGTDVFALVSQLQSRAPAEGRFEAHRRYVDVQYLVSGAEEILVTDVTPLTSHSAYDPGRDIEFFESANQWEAVPLRPGDLAILYPEDAHLPNCHSPTPSQLHKVVVKIALQLVRDPAQSRG
ncbi:MAG: YhcH/YjgK/YiaL family protein [Deltaproteobacteria bacterium]|nr:YhcH/YjgK/YiaL family protein [Deltaproteobacteria bacterium]